MCFYERPSIIKLSRRVEELVDHIRANRILRSINCQYLGVIPILKKFLENKQYSIPGYLRSFRTLSLMINSVLIIKDILYIQKILNNEEFGQPYESGVLRLHS